jgi:hypothetical protein
MRSRFTTGPLRSRHVHLCTYHPSGTCLHLGPRCVSYRACERVLRCRSPRREGRGYSRSLEGRRDNTVSLRRPSVLVPCRTSHLRGIGIVQRHRCPLVYGLHAHVRLPPAPRRACRHSFPIRCAPGCRRIRAQHRQLRGLPAGAHTDQSPVNAQFT